MAAEHAGGARWCLETATEYAKVRRSSSGGPIGQFQAIKHRLADMAIRVEQMTAVAWDAAVAVDTGHGEEADLAAATAAVLALDGYAEGAKECIQVLGGIGFTWEHDAHLHLKRAMADRQLMGDPDSLLPRGHCARRRRDPPDAHRRAARPTPTKSAAELAPVVEQLGATPERDRRRRDGRRGTGRAALADARGGGTPARSSRWSSTSSSPTQGSTAPTSGSAPGRCPRSSPNGTPEQHERWVDGRP